MNNYFVSMGTENGWMKSWNVQALNKREAKTKILQMLSEEDGATTNPISNKTDTYIKYKDMYIPTYGAFQIVKGE